MPVPRRRPKKGGDHNPPRRRQPDFNARAKRDIAVQNRPALGQLRQLRARTLADYRRDIGRAGSIYSQEQDALAGLAPQYGNQSEAILGNLRNVLGSFGATTGGLADENAAAGAALNSAARGALGYLGAGQESDLAALQASRSAAAMQGKETQLDYQGQQQDALDQLAIQRGTLIGGMPAQIRSRADELRQQYFENQLARSQAALNRKQVLSELTNNKALQQYLQDSIGGLLGGGGGGGGGGFGGGGGGGGPGGHQPLDGGGGSPGGGQPHGHGPSPLAAFASGHRPWVQMAPGGREFVRDRIQDYYTSHRNDPAFANITNPPGPHTMPSVADLIQAIRQYQFLRHQTNQGA